MGMELGQERVSSAFLILAVTGMNVHYRHTSHPGLEALDERRWILLIRHGLSVANTQKDVSGAGRDRERRRQRKEWGSRQGDRQGGRQGGRKFCSDAGNGGRNVRSKSGLSKRWERRKSAS